MKNIKAIILTILATLGIGGGVMGAVRLSQPQITLFSGAISPTTSVYMAVGSERTITCALSTEGVTGTLKFLGGVVDTRPDADSAQSVTNMWDYVQVVDTQNGTSIDGDTGLALAGDTSVTQYEVNTNYLKWFGADWTTATAGTSTLICRPSNNQ